MSWNVSCCITFTLLTCFLSSSAGVSGLGETQMHLQQQQVVTLRHPGTGSHLNLSFIQGLEKKCPQYCSEQLQYNSVCINQGCKQWKTGLRDGCANVCNGSGSNYRELYSCRLGCSKLVEDYYFHLKGLLGVLDPPTLIAVSLKSTSLRLSWEGSLQSLPYLVFTIQRKLYHRNQPWESITTEPLNQTSFTVEGLKPYTEYQFQVGWVVASDFPPLYSLGSNPITTLPKGLPSSPEITSVQPISNTSVAVTWLPPTQANGRLIAYILKLQNLSEGLRIKEIPFSQNPRGYTYSGLLPNTNYTLTISAQNLEGEGEAVSVSFVTPQTSISNDISKQPEPRLLIQRIKDIYLQELDPLLNPDVGVFVSDQNITAMAVHVKNSWVYIALSDGQIIRTEVEGNQSVVILSTQKLDIVPTFLSVDWLNQKLYLVGKKKRSSTWCIKKCELNGDKMTTVYSHLGAEPVDFTADPFTGFLYWVSVPTPSLRAGLYKMDLIGDDEQNARTLPLPLISVLLGADLGPFTVDFVNYRILVVARERNTVLAVSLDGDVTDIRRNCKNPMFSDVQSIAIYNGIFYWTTGESIVIEEYNAAENMFYHNIYDELPSSRLLILHPDLQPVPQPMAPPRLPQVIFSERRARIIWKPPATIANLGEGAWRDWKYQIRLSDNTSISNINDTEYVLDHLRPYTYYTIQVLAYSESGLGPPSIPFLGRTLRETPFNISLLWGAEEGLYSTDTLGENVRELVFPNHWKDSAEDLSISSLAWHEAYVFFAISNGSVFHYDGRKFASQPNTPTRLRGISFAQSLAYDYIGEKLYWSNPKKQAIIRCSVRDFDSGNPKLSSEWLQVVTMAKEIAIDSYKALLIWTTGHSLEMSRLNGYNHNVLFSVGLFSGIRIIGITLDTEHSRIYWISRSSLGSTLMCLSYKDKTMQTPLTISNFPDTTILGPIRYFNDRLIWLQGPSEAVVTDLNGQGKSLMTVNSITNISTIHVRDQSAQRFPAGLSRGKLNVTPNSVLPWSITVNGRSNNFTISWQSVNNTNFGKIFYQVTVNNYIAKPTSQTILTFENGTLFKPYFEIEISIVALTYWSSSKPTIVKRHTPSGKPSEPMNPRIFLETLSYPYSKTGGRIISGELRWDAITEPNGIVLGYVVHCWKDNVKTTDCNCEVNVEKLNCELKNLSWSSMYQFEVQGYTDAGTGNLSRRVQSNPRFSNPVPRLLLAANDKLQILDIDRNNLEPIPSDLTPMTATYLASDDTLYWFNEGQDLLRTKLDGSNKTRVLTLNSMEASHLTIDWIARKIYWIAELSEPESNQDGEEEKYRIMCLDLFSISSSPSTIIKSRTAIKSIAVNPFRNSLLWTTSRRNGIMTLYSSLTNGSSVEAFLSRDPLTCNCSKILSVGEAIAFDPNGFGNIKNGIVITDHESIWLTETGCECHQVVNMSAHSASRPMTPPFRVAVDEHHVYWVSNYLYASEKPGIGITELNAVSGPSGVREVLVIGPSVQPYPDLQCLLPRKLEPAEPILLNRSSHAFHVQLPVPYPVNCSTQTLFSLPTPKYEVYFGTVNEKGITECTPSSLIHCRLLKTKKALLDISSLNPYTTYTVFVTVTNYFAEMQGIPPLVSSPRMLRTAPGAPMPPKLLRLETLTPASVRVVWGRPEKLNGEKVWYEVQWQICTPIKSSVKRDGRIIWTEKESKSNQNHTEYSLDIGGLIPFTNYSVWVHAYSEKGDTLSQSEIRVIETFPSPNNLTLISATPHILSIEWKAPQDTSILSHQIVYRAGWSSIWNETEIVNFTVPGRSYNLSVLDLKPKTFYGFRIKAWYRGDPLHPYSWPLEGQFNMETQADKPGSPGLPVARGIGKSLYEVTWEKADDNGAAVDFYSLECKLEAGSYHSVESENSSTLKRRKREVGQADQMAEKFVALDAPVRRNNQWFVVYNGTESRWQVKDLDLNSHYSFRVRAQNLYGWGEFSQESAVVVMSALTIVAETQSVGIVLGVIALGILILGTFGFLFIYVYHRKLKEKPGLVNSLPSERRELELATLRELPIGSSFIHQSNILYATGDFLIDMELAGVPKIASNQIRQTKFLGRGAFGEVYEGLASNLPGHDNPRGTRVAIKTLRKGASNQDKNEFIEEAKLMMQFHHPHILQLIGICVDMDPCCLLLELMSGGDLLSHLRSSRTDPSLTLSDLLGMCIDVAKGCVYLEDTHFVHRDLAARNCLVRMMDSTTPSANPTQKHRVVKIGDFGLARDIYRSDYYRKEGEGLLPVRWMPQEALLDGVFTTQSDIWAFGVLLWEIMTLGRQPYHLKSNLEVLQFVTTGGTLTLPTNCPEALGSLMQQCWEFVSENRPSFKDCLAQLEALRNEIDGFNSYPADESTLANLPFQNYSSENPEVKGDYWQQSTHPRERGAAPGLGPDYIDSTPVELFNSVEGASRSFPKYLEVIADFGNPESVPSPTSPTRATPTEEDGYEIPLPRIPPRTQRDFHPLSPSSTIPSAVPYWNTRPNHGIGTDQNVELQYFVPFKNSRRSTGTVESESETESHYRNLLPSSTSEDADGDVDADVDNECLSSDEHPESLSFQDNYNNVFHLNLNPALLEQQMRLDPLRPHQHYEIPLRGGNGMTTPQVPFNSTGESDYDYNCFHNYYNRPCVNPANCG